MNAPERIYAWVWELRPNRGQWVATNDPVQGAVEYTRTDTIDTLSDPRVKALVEAAKEAIGHLTGYGSTSTARINLREALRAIEEGGE